MPGRGSYGRGGKWIYQRAKHIRSKNPDMDESTSFAIATQQAHKLGKSPKKFRTEQGVARAHAKYRGPTKMYKKTASPDVKRLLRKTKAMRKPRLTEGLSVVEPKIVYDREKVADIDPAMIEAGGVLSGLASGMSLGRGMAGHTAAGLAPKGRIIRSEDIARKAALIGAPVGGIAALALGRKYGLGRRAAELLARKAPRGLVGSPAVDQAVLSGVLPLGLAMSGSALGGLATGGLVGGIQKLRGSPYSKTAMVRGLFDELEKISQAPGGAVPGAPDPQPANVPATPPQDPASMIARKNNMPGTAPTNVGGNPGMPMAGMGT